MGDETSRGRRRTAFTPHNLDDWPRPFRTFRRLDEDETFIEYEGSSIFLPIRAEIDGAILEEEIKLRAFMRAELSPAYRSGLGTREFQFVIRDWELYGRSRLLSKLYYGDHRGRLRDEDDPSSGRQQAVMTWTLARHYEKHGDVDHAALAPIGADTLIDGVTEHNTDRGDLYWEVSPDGSSGRFKVEFHRAPLGARENDDLVASARDLGVGDHFIATSAVPEPEFAHNLPMRRETHGHGLSVRWSLGRDPGEGQHGSLHIGTQPKSICIANGPPIPGMEEDSSDFPAHIVYAANFEVWVNGDLVAPDQMGIAHAKGCRSIPPRDVKVAFEKPVRGGRFSFAAGMCLGMHEITREEYDDGVETARVARAAPA